MKVFVFVFGGFFMLESVFETMMLISFCIWCVIWCFCHLPAKDQDTPSHSNVSPNFWLVLYIFAALLKVFHRFIQLQKMFQVISNTKMCRLLVYFWAAMLFDLLYCEAAHRPHFFQFVCCHCQLHHGLKCHCLASNIQCSQHDLSWTNSVFSPLTSSLAIKAYVKPAMITDLMR